MPGMRSASARADSVCQAGCSAIEVQCVCMVGADVRQVEAEIDGCIQRMPVWSVKRDVLLRRLMTIWRDGLEVVHLKFAHAMMFQVERNVESAVAIEHLMATGVYRALKWAMEFAHDEGAGDVSDKDLVDLVMNVAGGPYQVLVDALKLGAYDKAEFSVDQQSKTLTIYEGGDVSGHDAAIVRYDRVTVAFHQQSPLVDDTDQLTTLWTADEYRQYWRWLRPIAEAAETETILGQAGPLAPMQEIMKRPVVFEIPKPPAPLAKVQQDLTLTPAKLQTAMKWKIDSWHDCPLVQIGDRVSGISSTILALAGSDDYMLRVAAMNDPAQYERVSGLREARMIALCQRAFQGADWTFTPHYRLTDPSREIDGYATKTDDIVIVQLKSTLRPQSPWEVYKRNADVIEGITHTSEMLHRVGQGAIGIVITDGYEGDYATWKESLATGVAVATLADLDWIVKNPHGAFKILSERAGIVGNSTAEGVPERSASLCGWTLRVVDEPRKKIAPV
jgi:hypothetical protein